MQLLSNRLPKSLKQGWVSDFRIERPTSRRHYGNWAFFCKNCGQGYSYPHHKIENINPLGMIDHAIGCKMTPEERAQALREAEL